MNEEMNRTEFLTLLYAIKALLDSDDIEKLKQVINKAIEQAEKTR